jgi:hypothetical protein
MTETQTQTPVEAPPPTVITVDEARALAAQHNQDRLVIISWSNHGPLNIVHVGATPEDSEASKALANFTLKALGYDTETVENVNVAGTC